MSKPAASIGDMDVCPLATPGTPPIPHVGGPITGPGVATVLIGGMPAAVMGDMCVCTGPPDTIALGSIGVMIGNKPAARMGDMCGHGGSITVGCPTVLIGEVGSGGGGMANAKTVLNKIAAEVSEAAALVKAQELSLITAAFEGIPFCEICEAASEEEEEEGQAHGGSTNTEEDEETTPTKEINKIYFADADGNEISEIEEETTVFLTIESKEISGEEVIINLYDHPGDFTYEGNDIENDQLTVTVSGDEHRIELGVKINAT